MVGVLHHMVNDPAQVLAEIAMRWALDVGEIACYMLNCHAESAEI